MFEIGDRVILNDVEHNALKVVKIERNSALLENRNSERFWMPCECLHKAPKREVEITVKVEVSDDAKYVAMDSSGEVFEYLGECLIFGDCFDGSESRQLTIKNWKETKTKVGGYHV